MIKSETRFGFTSLEICQYIRGKLVQINRNYYKIKINK